MSNNYLFHNNGDVTFSSNEDMNKTLLLIMNGDEEKAIETIKENIRLRKGMPNIKSLETEKDMNGSTLLMASIFYERNKLTDFLIPISNLNAISNDGTTAIGCACLANDIRSIKLIYDYMGEDIKNLFFKKNNKGNSPFDYLLQHIILDNKSSG